METKKTAHVLDVAKWFVKHNFDSPRNSLEGNMKLQKLIYFAQLIHLAKFDEPLFDEPILAYENGCVVEQVRTAYKNNCYSFVYQARTLKECFAPNQIETLRITAEIFGKIEPDELSELNHLHLGWKEAYSQSKGNDGFRYRENSVVSLDVIRENDLKEINEMLDAFEITQGYKQHYIVIDGVTFYYDPQEIELTERVISELKEFPKDEIAYSLCFDENVGLIIY